MDKGRVREQKRGSVREEGHVRNEEYGGSGGNGDREGNEGRE